MLNLTKTWWELQSFGDDHASEAEEESGESNSSEFDARRIAGVDESEGSEEVGVGDAFDEASAVRAPTRRRRRRRRRQPEGLGRLAKVTEVGATRARRLSAQGSA